MMPRGLKRNHEGDPAPTVGGAKINDRKVRKMTVEKDSDLVAMKQVQGKQTQNRHVSKWAVKAKRQLDFIYENDNEINQVEKTERMTMRSIK